MLIPAKIMTSAKSSHDFVDVMSEIIPAMFCLIWISGSEVTEGEGDNVPLPSSEEHFNDFQRGLPNVDNLPETQSRKIPTPSKNIFLYITPIHSFLSYKIGNCH